MANEEFWETAKPAANDKKEEQKYEDISDEELQTMSIKTKKPEYNIPTEATITGVTFKKDLRPGKDSKEIIYTPFNMVVSYHVESDGSNFYETCGGGRFYTNEGVRKEYIGPTSAMGRIKALCISSKIDIGMTFPSWAKALIGKKVMLKAEPTLYAGKKGYKNMPVSFVQ